MDNPHSARGSVGSARPAAPDYGYIECGADWAEADRVLVVLHGRDRAPEDLIELFLTQEQAHDTRILAPYAPDRSWYAGRYNAPIAENETAVAEGLAHIGAVMALGTAHGVELSRTVLAGFSQGACMALEYLLGVPARPAAAAVFTGSVLGIAGAGEAQPDFNGLPVLMTGGDGDPWLPVGDLRASAALMEMYGADVHLEIFPDSDHAVRDRELTLLGQLIDRVAA